MGTVVGILERERREYVASFEVSITHQVRPVGLFFIA